MEARDLLDHVDLAGDVAHAPGRDGHRSRLGLEPEPPEEGELVLRRHLQAHDGVRAFRPEPELGARRQRVLDVRVPAPAGAGQLDDQLGRQHRRLAGQVRVDTLLPPVRALRAEPQPLGAPQDPDRLEVRRLEQDVRGRVADLGLLAAHDRRQRDRSLGVGDQQVPGLERARAARRASAAVSPGRARRTIDSAARERVVVEGVQRVPERDHHVVGHVDDVRDRPHPGGGQPGLSQGGDGPIATSRKSRPT